MKTKDQSKLPVWPAMLLSTGALLYSAVSLAAPPAADAQAQARALLSPPVQHGAVAKPSDSVARTAPSAIPVGDAQLQAQQLFLARVRADGTAAPTKATGVAFEGISGHRDLYAYQDAQEAARHILSGGRERVDSPATGVHAAASGAMAN